MLEKLRIKIVIKKCKNKFLIFLLKTSLIFLLRVPCLQGISLSMKIKKQVYSYPSIVYVLDKTYNKLMLDIVA